jgi:nucleotide-binding universal stress UspA family protein
MYVKEVPLGPMVKGDPSPIAGEEELLESLRSKLKDECRDVLTAQSVEGDGVQYHVERSGAVAPALVRHAKKVDAGLIVMGTKGQRGLQEAFVGSVAREVLRTAPCPVLTARALTTESPSDEGTVSRAVVPIDFSDPAREALQYAGRISSIYEVPIKLVHVVESPKLPSVYELESPKISGRKVKARAERALEDWGHDLLTGRREVSYVVQHGDPATLILDAAPSADDLVVMATRGLSGVRRTMLGSVTEEVICKASGPVLAGRTFPADA